MSENSDYLDPENLGIERKMRSIVLGLDLSEKRGQLDLSVVLAQLYVGTGSRNLLSICERMFDAGFELSIETAQLWSKRVEHLFGSILVGG